MTIQDLMDGQDQFIWTCIFENVTRRSGFERLHHIWIGALHREHDEARIRQTLEELSQHF